MDEERRTTINLMECIRAIKSRVFFINTGFLDRISDEIHTAMEAGPMICKKARCAISPGSRPESERRRRSSLRPAGARPDRQGHVGDAPMMAAMLEQKIAQPQAGANTAWVPSPTAATLHAMHYQGRRRQAAAAIGVARPRQPRRYRPSRSPEASTGRRRRCSKLDNNAQGILGYVVRWTDQGVGCSKVLRHQQCRADGRPRHVAHLEPAHRQLAATRHHLGAPGFGDARCRRRWSTSRMPAIRPICRWRRIFEKSASAAACDLVLQGAAQPNGYTEPILHARGGPSFSAATGLKASLLPS